MTLRVAIGQNVERVEDRSCQSKGLMSRHHVDSRPELKPTDHCDTTYECVKAHNRDALSAAGD
jgi:hypothetical protein